MIKRGTLRSQGYLVSIGIKNLITSTRLEHLKNEEVFNKKCPYRSILAGKLQEVNDTKDCMFQVQKKSSTQDRGFFLPFSIYCLN